jgi:hypothetical protein
MTAAELLKDQLDDSGFQLSKVLEGMSEKCLDHKITTEAMTPREQVAHLCEAYEAFRVNSAGGKYEWGSYVAPSQDMAALKTEFEKKRGEAVAQAENNPTPETMKSACDFIVGHDFYHVGQMCLARLAIEPEWNCYSIYRG